MALEFDQSNKDISIDDEFDSDLIVKTTNLANNICRMDPPKTSENPLRGEMLIVIQEITENLGKIPKHAKFFGNHHYLLYLSPMKWKEAKKFCESVSGHLATITSQEENRWIAEIFPQESRF